MTRPEAYEARYTTDEYTRLLLCGLPIVREV